MKDMMNALTHTMPTDKRFLMQTANAASYNPKPSVPKTKENNMSILKIWHEHRQWLIKPCMRKY